MIKIVGGPMKPIVRVPVKGGATVYVGGLCALDTSAVATDSGIIMLPAAVGASNTTNLDVPLGIIKGLVLYDKTYTGGRESATAGADASSHSSTTNFRPRNLPYRGSVHRLYADVQLIGPETYLEAPICNAALGTPPSVLTVSTGSTTGAGCTTGAADFTPVAGLCSAYFRTGANKGQMLTTSDVSATIMTFLSYAPKDIAIGDTLVRVPLRDHGFSYIQFDGTYSDFINCAASPAADYYAIDMLDLRLDVPGKETAVFKFNADNFCLARA